MDDRLSLIDRNETKKTSTLIFLTKLQKITPKIIDEHSSGFEVWVGSELGTLDTGLVKTEVFLLLEDVAETEPTEFEDGLLIKEDNVDTDRRCALRLCWETILESSDDEKI